MLLLPERAAFAVLAAAIPLAAGAESWDEVRAADVAQVAPGWSAPRRLEVNTDHWEDSAFVTPDGRAIYFAYYPGENLLGDFLRGEFRGDIDIYVSEAPFRDKRKVDRFGLSDPTVSAGGVMIDDHGNWWYHSNHEGLKTGTFDDDLYRNERRLPFNDERSFHNPHYCAAQDELWFDGVPNEEIAVIRRAVATDFRAPIELAPAPINSSDPEVHDAVPWLSADCRTIYFVSDRGNRPRGGWIYRSQRGDDGRWSEPVPIVRSRIGVGEPTLTADGRKLFFAHVFRKANGDFTSDLFYIERTDVAAAAPGAAAPAPPAAPAPRSAGGPIPGLVGLGASEGLDRVAGGLRWRYTIGTSPLPVITTSAGLGVTAQHQGVALRLKADSASHIAVVLDESAGARYDRRIRLPAGEWVELDIPWSEFALQSDSRDANARLDPTDVGKLTIIDIGGFLGFSGANRIDFERLELWAR